MLIKYKRKVNVDVIKYGSIRRFVGLMFSRREKARALLFEFKKRKLSLHSMFVFFPFVAFWLDNNNKVLQVKEIKPFRFCILCKKDFSKIVEIPINKRYKKILNLLS